MTFLKAALVLIKPGKHSFHAVEPRVAVVGIGGHHSVSGPFEPIVSFLENARHLRRTSRAREPASDPSTGARGPRCKSRASSIFGNRRCAVGGGSRPPRLPWHPSPRRPAAPG